MSQNFFGSGPNFRTISETDFDHDGLFERCKKLPSQEANEIYKQRLKEIDFRFVLEIKYANYDMFRPLTISRDILEHQPPNDLWTAISSFSLDNDGGSILLVGFRDVIDAIVYRMYAASYGKG